MLTGAVRTAAGAAEICKYPNIRTCLMARAGIYVKGVKEEVYREVKAQSARLGKTVSEVVTSALEDWLRWKAPEEDREFLQNNLAYEALEEELSAKYLGRYVAFEKGRIIGAADTLDALTPLMSDVDHRIVVRVGEDRPTRRTYLGGSSLRRTAS